MNTFASNEHFLKSSEDINKSIADCSKEKFIKHHKKKYNNQYPIWVVVETLSFGKLSRIFSSLKKEYRKAIAEKYYSNIHFYFLDQYFYSLTVLRNMCAHHSRLFNKGISHPVAIDNDDLKYLNNKDIDANSFNKKLFARIIYLFRIINSKESLNDFINKIHNLHEQYPFTNLKHYGFPEDWETVLIDLTQ